MVINSPRAGAKVVPGVPLEWSDPKEHSRKIAESVNALVLVANAADDSAASVTPTNRTTSRTLALQATLAQGVLDVTDPDYGAVGDGVADDTAAVQAALTTASASGGPVYFPRGRYLISTGLTLSILATGTNTDLERNSIIGDGASSIIEWTGSGGGNPLLKVTGTNDPHHEFFIQGLRLIATNRDVNGLHLQDLAYWKLDNIYISNFANGLHLRDAISGSIHRSRLINNTRHIDGDKDDSFNPNAISLHACILTLAKEYAIYLDTPTQLNIYGGTVEGNGTDSTTFPTNRGGIKIVTPSTGGGVAANFNGVYFENNDGVADIEVDMGTSDAIVNANGCNFNRISSSQFVTNNILIKHDSGDGKIRLNVIGSAFQPFNTYVPDAGRLYWAFSGTGTKRSLCALNNEYGNATETPAEAGANIDLALMSEVVTIRLTDINGGFHEIIANAGTLSLRADHGGDVANSILSFQVDGGEKGRFDGATGDFQIGGANTVIDGSRIIRPRSYTVAGLPSAATASGLIYVSNETGGATLAFSDGTNWRRVQDRAIVS